MDRQQPGPSPCCSHPHGKGLNVAAGVTGILALGPALGNCLVLWSTSYTYYYRSAAAVTFGTIAPVCGLVAMIITWTATCCAYRPRGLASLTALYAVSSASSILSSILLTVEENRYNYLGPVSYGLSIPSALLWLSSAICTFMMPKYKETTNPIINQPEVIKSVVEYFPDGSKTTITTTTYANGTKTVEMKNETPAASENLSPLEVFPASPLKNVPMAHVELAV